MADAIRYSSTDVDGPGMPPAGSMASRLFHVLYPCLVAGYGDKPDQGWELVDNAGDAGFTLLSPDGVYVCFSSWGSQYSVEVYLAESLSPPYQYPPVGINVRSQDWSADYTSSVTLRHRVSMGIVGVPNYTSAWWCVVARGAQVLFFFAKEALTSSINNVYSKDGAFFMGNLRLRDNTAPVSGVQNFVFLGGNNAVSSTNAASIIVTPFDVAHTRLRNPISGVVETGALAELTGLPWAYYQSASRTQAPERMPDLALIQCDARLSGEGSIGYMPGLFVSPAVSTYVPSAVLSGLDVPIEFSALDVPVLVAGEPFYMVPSERGMLFVSVDEAYW